MMIEFINGSTWQLIGSDRYDSLVGTNPVGVLFSEYALSDPQAWDYIRPILTENGGWAWFISTPRGKNHFWQLYEMALRNEEWHCERLTVDDTDMITEADIQAERDSGMAESTIQQEYYCSFEEGGAQQFIPQEYIEEAKVRISRPLGPKIMGVDPARFGDDHTAVVFRDGDRLKWIMRWTGRDTMWTAGKVAELIRTHKPDATFVDMVGLGSGVLDRLNQLGYRPIGANAGAKAGKDHMYINKRAEMWGRMRDWLRDKGDIPDDPVLLSDLAMLEFEYDARNRIKLEKKEDMKKRGLPSPDIGDALALTFYNHIPIKEIQDWNGEVALTDYAIEDTDPHEDIYAA